MFLIAVAICACSPLRPTFDSPSIIALSTETPTSENPELVRQCLPLAQRLAESMHYKLGTPHFTHSDKWGDVLRIELDNEDNNLTARLACAKNITSVGVTPAGSEELVPSGLQGVWAIEGKCTLRSALLVLTATSAQFGTAAAFEIRYFPNGYGQGHGEFWAADGSALTPQYAATKDVMVWVEKAGRTTYQRCPTQR